MLMMANVQLAAMQAPGFIGSLKEADSKSIYALVLVERLVSNAGFEPDGDELWEEETERSEGLVIPENS